MNAIQTAEPSAAAASDCEIVLSRVFDAPRELVWQVWTDPRHTDQWWGPRGFTNTTHEHDLQVGGVWRYTMHGPDGTAYPNRQQFLEVDPPARLAYSHGWDAPGGEMFRAVITFVELGAGRTEVQMRSIFASAAERNKVVEQYGAIEGGRQTLERLGEYLAAQQAELDGDRAAVTSRLIGAPPAAVQRAIVTPELLAQWWGPAGFTSTFHECDIRPGGRWRLTMHGPDGRDFENEYEFVETGPERVVLRRMAETHDFRLSIALIPSGNGTLVEWHQLFATAQELDECRQIVIPANEENLDRLAAVVVGQP